MRRKVSVGKNTSIARWEPCFGGVPKAARWQKIDSPSRDGWNRILGALSADRSAAADVRCRTCRCGSMSGAAGCSSSSRRRIVFVIWKREARWLALTMIVSLFAYNLVSMASGVGRFPSIAFVVLVDASRGLLRPPSNAASERESLRPRLPVVGQRRSRDTGRVSWPSIPTTSSTRLFEVYRERPSWALVGWYGLGDAVRARPIGDGERGWQSECGSSAAIFLHTCARCLVCLHLKGVPYEIDPIIPFMGDERFSTLSPLRRIPVLIDDRVTLSDSSGDLPIPRGPLPETDAVPCRRCRSCPRALARRVRRYTHG